MGAALRRARLLFGAALLLLALPPCALLVALGGRRIATPLWCRLGLWTLSLSVEVKGHLPPPGSLVAANHISYADILVLGAYCPGAFVAKSEVADWPLVGFAARLAGTLFIERTKARSVHRSLAGVRKKLASGERVLLFPEGGILSKAGEVTRFHAMFFAEEAVGGSLVAPTAIKYRSPADPRVWAWTDDSTPSGHAFRNFVPGGPVKARLSFGEPFRVGPGDGRREVADRAREYVVKLLENDK